MHVPSRARGRLALICGLLLGAAAPAAAQRIGSEADTTGQAWLDRCRDNDRGRDEGERYCEIRVARLSPERSLDVDAGQNGSVRVHGWDQDQVRVVAKVQTWAEDFDAAKELASQITIETRDGRIRAEGPSTRRRESWAVSYEIWTPHATNITAAGQNGSLAIESVDGHADLNTVNGSITVQRTTGDIRGQTTNGSLNAMLDGDRWEGAGLDLRTTNGSVNLAIPDGYSARLETGTVNGGMRIDFPITVQGSIGRRLSTQLGSGGPLIRAVTVNGSVNIRRR